MQAADGTVLIAPYVEVDGIRTLTDSYVKELYALMERDKTAGVVFHDGQIKDADAFLRHMRSPGVLLYLVLHRGERVGAIWLTHTEWRTARVHFVAFSEAWKKNSVEIGRDAISQVMFMKDTSGGYVFDCLQGLLPSWNARAIKWLLQVGLKVAGEIPNALWDASQGKSVSGTMLYLTRDLLRED